MSQEKAMTHGERFELIQCLPPFGVRLDEFWNSFANRFRLHSWSDSPVDHALSDVEKVAIVKLSCELASAAEPVIRMCHRYGKNVDALVDFKHAAYANDFDRMAKLFVDARSTVEKILWAAQSRWDANNSSDIEAESELASTRKHPDIERTVSAPSMMGTNGKSN